ncbi:MAG: 50S ribosomal protein L34e [Promethearchaeota archaeon]|nr:MAG: 50S ribosomal protein L34e [Candidatus Lokiarchaeota archaeon]
MPRPNLRSKSQKRKDKRTPGNKNVKQYWRKRPGKARCAICKKPLQSVPRERPSKMKKTNKVSRRPTRPESGHYCPNCLKELIEDAVRNQ